MVWRHDGSSFDDLGCQILSVAEKVEALWRLVKRHKRWDMAERRTYCGRFHGVRYPLTLGHDVYRLALASWDGYRECAVAFYGNVGRKLMIWIHSFTCLENHYDLADFSDLKKFPLFKRLPKKFLVQLAPTVLGAQ